MGATEVGSALADVGGPCVPSAFIRLAIEVIEIQLPHEVPVSLPLAVPEPAQKGPEVLSRLVAAEAAPRIIDPALITDAAAPIEIEVEVGLAVPVQIARRRVHREIGRASCRGRG